MGVDLLPFGVLLRRWRQRRRMTQMDLAFAANSSTRHLSYLETGRAQPSRDIIMRLAEDLKVPLRERNTLLLSAGFAPAFQETSLAELSAARTAIEQVLQAHKPYPAFAVDRHWNIVLSNGALPQVYADVAPDLMRPPINAVRLMLHPLGLAPRIVNLEEWQQHVITVLRQQIEASLDSGVQALLAEVMTYPLPANTGRKTTNATQRYATPLQLATDVGVLSFLNTTTIFGTPIDVTLSELALEMLFPADAETVTIVRKLAQDDALPERAIVSYAATPPDDSSSLTVGSGVLLGQAAASGADMTSQSAADMTLKPSQPGGGTVQGTFVGSPA